METDVCIALCVCLKTLLRVQLCEYACIKKIRVTKHGFHVPVTCLLCATGHSGPRKIPNNYYCLLPWCYGLHSHVWRHKRGIFQCCSRLVSSDSVLLVLWAGNWLLFVKMSCWLLWEIAVTKNILNQDNAVHWEIMQVCVTRDSLDWNDAVHWEIMWIWLLLEIVWTEMMQFTEKSCEYDCY